MLVFRGLSIDHYVCFTAFVVLSCQSADVATHPGSRNGKRNRVSRGELQCSKYAPSVGLSSRRFPRNLFRDRLMSMSSLFPRKRFLLRLSSSDATSGDFSASSSPRLPRNRFLDFFSIEMGVDLFLDILDISHIESTFSVDSFFINVERHYSGGDLFPDFFLSNWTLDFFSTEVECVLLPRNRFRFLFASPFVASCFLKNALIVPRIRPPLSNIMYTVSGGLID